MSHGKCYSVSIVGVVNRGIQEDRIRIGEEEQQEEQQEELQEKYRRRGVAREVMKLNNWKVYYLPVNLEGR